MTFFGNRPGGALGTFAGGSRTTFSASGHMLELMMSPQQRAPSSSSCRSPMALMEGYSNHVMQRVGTVQSEADQVLRTTFESRPATGAPGSACSSSSPGWTSSWSSTPWASVTAGGGR